MRVVPGLDALFNEGRDLRRCRATLGHTDGEELLVEGWLKRNSALHFLTKSNCSGRRLARHLLVPFG